MSCVSFLLFVTLLVASQLNDAVLRDDKSTYDQEEQPSGKSQVSLARILQSANAGIPQTVRGMAPGMAPEKSPSPAAPTTSPSPAVPMTSPSPASPTMSPSPASPTVSPPMEPEPEELTCVEFAMDIALAMEECAKTVLINNCEWSRSCGYMGSELQVDDHHNSKTCCCACQKVDACNALQREFLTGRCIFHCGGRPSSTTDYFAFCWKK